MHSGEDYYVMRYNARPSSFNPYFTWSIGETEDFDGMYCVYYSPDEWMDELIANYDYVALYKLNEYFFTNYYVLFEDPNQISENAVYYIDKEARLLKRCQQGT